MAKAPVIPFPADRPRRRGRRPSRAFMWDLGRSLAPMIEAPDDGPPIPALDAMLDRMRRAYERGDTRAIRLCAISLGLNKPSRYAR